MLTIAAARAAVVETSSNQFNKQTIDFEINDANNQFLLKLTNGPAGSPDLNLDFDQLGAMRDESGNEYIGYQEFVLTNDNSVEGKTPAEASEVDAGFWRDTLKLSYGFSSKDFKVVDY